MKISRFVFVSVFLSVLCLLMVRTAQAQDVVKVGADTHSVLLENDQVRVLDVHMKHGDKVSMHSHPANVAYYLTDGKVRITTPDGKTVEREVKAGTSVWNEPATHKVENIGGDFHEIQIEMKQAAKK
jgi:beta-alanine degradation protein BauB